MKLFICCSAINNIDKKYFDDSEKLFNIILKDNDLVFGAWDEGIMKLSYDIAKKYNRKVIGITPKFYKDVFSRIECDKEVVTDTMLESTLRIIENSDAVIWLPGGIGTTYELFTALQSKRIHDHNLPIIIYNSFGYYDKLLDYIEHTYKEKFSEESIRDLYYVANTIDDVVNYLKKISIKEH